VDAEAMLENDELSLRPILSSVCFTLSMIFLLS